MTNSDTADRSSQKLPRHVAIIMDGNGRWAERRGLKRVEGHRQGAETAQQISEECSRLGIERLTLYAFSLENWKRPKAEVITLMKLLKKFLKDKRAEMKKEKIRFSAIGRLHMLPADTRRELDKTISATEANDGLNLCLALSYGGRAEVVDAARALARQAAPGAIDPDAIDQEMLSRELYQPGVDPDLMIRTAGEMRLSNFLLWQASYSEFYVTEKCWPEFTAEEFQKALDAYDQRIRKFGGLKTGIR